MNEEQTMGKRSRVVTWDDPTPGIQSSRTMSGLDYLRAIQTGDLPAAPIAHLLGMWIEEVSEGRVVFAAKPGEDVYNPIGTVHGGLAATLLDSAMACAVHSTLPAGTAYTTVELKVNYLRAMTDKTGVVTCEGKVIHVGGRIATAEGRLTDASGKLLAHGTTTCMVMRPGQSG